jgi:hypothetical protein
MRSEGKSFHLRSHSGERPTVCKGINSIVPLTVPSDSVDISTVPNHELEYLHLKSAELNTATDKRELN